MTIISTTTIIMTIKVEVEIISRFGNTTLTANATELFVSNEGLKTNIASS